MDLISNRYTNRNFKKIKIMMTKKEMEKIVTEAIRVNMNRKDYGSNPNVFETCLLQVLCDHMSGDLDNLLDEFFENYEKKDKLN
jgi:hypothetical protein